MAGWDGEANWSRDVLERIVVLLFFLAGLAELAADAPFLRRRKVLGILSHGEAAARAFVIGVSTCDPAPAEALDTADDAARLAASFRALALALCAMLAQATQTALPGAPGPRAGRLSRTMSSLAVRGPDTPATPAPDTS